MGKKKKSKLLTALWALGLCVLIALQFSWFSLVPPGMMHDEIEYTLSSRTYSLFGEDISGVPFPLSLLKTETHGRISAIPPLVLSPLWNFLPLNQETIRFLYVVLSILTAALVGYLAFILFKKRAIGLIAFTLYLLNPWSHFLAKFTGDPPFGLFFYLLGIILLLRLKDSLLFLGLIPFILGFFSYNGAKIILLPIIFICLGFRLYQKYSEKRKDIHQEILFLVGTLGFIVLFALTNRLIPDSIVSDRMNEIVFLNSDLLTSNVNLFRLETISSPATSLFINKITESLRLFLEHYLVAFSPAALFLSGDPTSIFGFYYHGLFYFIDLPLLLIGGFMLFKQRRKAFAFLLLLIVIAPIPTAVSIVGEAIVTRSFMLLPLFIIVISYGVYALCTSIKNPHYQKLLISSIVVCIGISYSYFFYFYFFRLPIVGQENFITSERVLAKYVTLESEKANTVVVIHPEKRQVYLETVFYSNPTKQTQYLTQNKTAFLQKKYVLDNITFTNTCPKKIDPNTTYVLPNLMKKCFEKSIASYSIVQRSDSGKLFKIINGNLCKQSPPPGWQGNHAFSDFDIESMTEETFCNRWLIR